MPDPSETPYAGLTPDCMLDALESVGYLCDGRFLALNSYENRVYQIYLEDGPAVVAKFYRPNRWTDEQILEEHEFVRELVEAEVPVVAPLDSGGISLHRFGEFRFAVYPRQGGRAPELDYQDTLERIGRFIGRIHAVGRTRSFRVRPALDIHAFGEEPRDFLLAENFIPPDLASAWSGVVDQALAGVRRCYERAGRIDSIRLHGDCYPSNVLWTDQGPHFVDFDDCRMGPAVQDLWMMLSGDGPAMAKQFGDLLLGYEDFCQFDPREIHLVEALRTLRLIHYCAWLARRWNDPAFPMAFPWFNTQRYWQDRVLELREQIALMDDPPLQAIA